MSKVVHLWREEREQRIVNVCVCGLAVARLCEDVGSTFFSYMEFVISYRSRVRRSGVYPPQQSAPWHNRNRLLDFRHVICIVVRSVHLLLETVRYIVTAVTL